MKSKKRVLRILALLLSAIMLLAGCNAESAEKEPGDESQSNGKVMILYTSDMHCGVDDGHSHDLEQVVMKNKDGDKVMRTACGSKLQARIIIF